MDIRFDHWIRSYHCRRHSWRSSELQIWLINVPINFMWKMIWKESHKTWNEDLVFLRHTPYRACTSHSCGTKSTFSDRDNCLETVVKTRGFWGDRTLSGYLPPHTVRPGRNLEKCTYTWCTRDVIKTSSHTLQTGRCLPPPWAGRASGKMCSHHSSASQSPPCTRMQRNRPKAALAVFPLSMLDSVIKQHNIKWVYFKNLDNFSPKHHWQACAF